MTDFSWTSERDDLLRAMRADGVPFSLIAARFGCGRNSAIGRAHRLGIVGAPRKRSEGGRPRKPRSITVPKPNNFAGVNAKRRVDRPVAPVCEVVELPPEPPRRPSKRCTIFAVTGCRFIFGDPRDAGHSYCNAPRIEGLSWCGFHARLCLNQYGGKD
jgi:hypothetical protein